MATKTKESTRSERIDQLQSICDQLEEWTGYAVSFAPTVAGISGELLGLDQDLDIDPQRGDLEGQLTRELRRLGFLYHGLAKKLEGKVGAA